MQILLLNYELPPLGGGAGHATYHTALALAQRGHGVHVLTSRYQDLPPFQRVEGAEIHRVRSLRRGIHKCGITGAVSYVAGAMYRMPELMRRLQPDICHYYFSLPTGVLSFYSHGLQGVPYVLSLRGSDVPAYDRSKLHMRALHTALRTVNCRIWRRAAHVTALSESLREQALCTDPTVPIDVVPNGIDARQYSPPPGGRGEHSPLRLICVCRLVARKGIDVLLQAMKLLEDAPVVLEIVGSGELEDALHRQAAELGVQERVRFAGFVGQHRLPARYRNADIFVLPSLAESFGIVLLEAMSSGLPVVATTVGGIPETVEHGSEGLLVAPGDAHALADAIRALAANPGLRAKLGANSVRKVQEHYTWERIAERYERIYRRALGGDALGQTQ